jgi:predicted dehydrogenase
LYQIFNPETMTTRRTFIKNTAVTTAAIGLAPAFSSALAGCAPSDRINIGLIGCNGMGFADLSAFLEHPQVECTALCDIDESVLNKRAADVEKIRGKKPANLYKDWRQVIDNKDINLVIVGTPDHWHCIQMVAACEAGKDVYCEKPIGRTIEECNLMVKAAKKNKSVVQVGQWQRSDKHWQEAVDFIQSGKLGKIRLVRVFSYQGWCPSIPVIADESVPAGVDYDMWLGPAPNRPFNRNRFHFTFRWFWDYAGGLMTDWGVHLLDYALFGMNVTAPKSIMAMGGKYGYPDDACETPDSLQTIYEFDGFNVLWDHAIGIDDGAYGRNHGLGFVGENGTLVVDRSGWEVIPEVVSNIKRMEAVPLRQGDGRGLKNHVKNHLDCITKRNPDTNANIEIGAHIAKFSALGNIAYRTGKKLIWDGTSFTNDNDANKYLLPVYREPWMLPKI